MMKVLGFIVLMVSQFTSIDGAAPADNTHMVMVQRIGSGMPSRDTPFTTDDKDPTYLCSAKAPDLCERWKAAKIECQTPWSIECPHVDHPSGNNNITLLEGCPYACSSEDMAETRAGGDEGQELARSAAGNGYVFGEDADKKTKLFFSKHSCHTWPVCTQFMIDKQGFTTNSMCETWMKDNGKGRFCGDQMYAFMGPFAAQLYKLGYNLYRDYADTELITQNKIEWATPSATAEQKQEAHTNQLDILKRRVGNARYFVSMGPDHSAGDYCGAEMEVGLGHDTDNFRGWVIDFNDWSKKLDQAYTTSPDDLSNVAEIMATYLSGKLTELIAK